MDIETVYLFVGVFLLSVVMLVVLQRLFKNKSYEEVVAEQKLMNQALFGNQQKPKVKDKKQKKALKKSKEKKSQDSTGDEQTPEEQTSDQMESAEEPSVKAEVETTVQVHRPHAHVEFKEPTVIEEPIKETKRKQRRESVKPILVNRDSSAELINDVVEVPLANHFEESHPKDEFELQSAHISHSHQAKEEVKADKKKKQQVADKKSKHQTNEIISKIEKVVEQQKPIQEAAPKHVEEVKEVKEPLVTNAVATQNGHAAVPAKDKKKKKSELNALTQNSDKLGANLTQLIALVRKSDMTKQDVQTLIDVLLNKQHDAPTFIDEWSEGKGDPVQKLKKQLAEKTQLSTELQEALTGVQNKLRDVRAEHSTDRAQLQQRVREAQELAALANMEKSTLEHKLRTLTDKCQHLEDRAKEEAAKTRQIFDDYQHLCVQRQQLEATVNTLAERERDVEALQQQMASLSEKLTRDSQGYVVLTNKLKEECDRKEIFLRDAHGAKTHLENQLQAALVEKDKLAKDLTMLHDQMCNNDMNNKAFQQQAEDANMELTKCNNDLRQLRKEAHLFQEQLTRCYEENKKLQEEYTKLNNQNSLTTQEKHKLQEELQKLQEAKTNGSIEMDKQHQVIITQLKTELRNTRNQLEQNDESSRLKLDTIKKQYDSEVEELRNKNNKLVTQIRDEERASRAKFIKRLFPSIEVSSNLSQADWEAAIEDGVQAHIKKLTPVVSPTPTPTTERTEEPKDDAELIKLRSKISEYEKIISETESILYKLQTHVEDEQIRWRRELRSKEESIASLNEQLAKNKENNQH